MKKNVKNVLVASTAALALVGSLIGCAQPVAPTPADKSKETTKDVFEQNLETARMEAESLFGENIVKFYDVNYAADTNFELYRFGPTDDKLKGKKIDLSTAKNESLDSWYIVDKVSKDNPMKAGSYTYKLIAKSAVNSARAVDQKIDLGNKAEKDPANQDYWANPEVDIVYIPSIASITLNVPESNMPKYKSKLTITKGEVPYVKYDVFDSIYKNNKTYYVDLIPTEKISDIVLEARIHGLDSNWDKDTVKKSSKTFVTTESSNTISIPATLAGNWDVYAYRTFYKDETKAENEKYYLDSDKVLLETIKVDPIQKIGDVSVTQATVFGKNTGLTWTLLPEFKGYTFEAQRAEKIPYKYANNTTTPANDYYYGDVVKAEFDITNKVIKEVKNNVEVEKEVVFTAIDKTAKPNTEYVYFWTIKDTDGEVVDYDEIVISNKAIDLKLSTYLTLSDITTNQLTPKALNATDIYWDSLVNEFTVTVQAVNPSTGTDAEKAAIKAISAELIKGLANKETKVNIVRVATGTNKAGNKIAATKTLSDTEYKIGTRPDGNSMYITVIDPIPFKEEYGTNEYAYWFTFTDKNGNVFEAYNGLSKTPSDKTPSDKTPSDKTPSDKTPSDKTPADKTPADKTPADKTPAVTPTALGYVNNTVTKARFVNTVAIAADKSNIKIDQTSITIPLKFTATAITDYSTRVGVNPNTPVLNRADLDKIPLSAFDELRYNVKCVNNNNLIIKDELVNVANKTIASTGKDAVVIKITGLIPGYRYSIETSQTVTDNDAFDTLPVDLAKSYSFAVTPTFAYPNVAESAPNFGNSKATLTSVVKIAALPTNKDGKFADFELVDITRKVKTSDKQTKIVDTVWKKPTSPATSVEEMTVTYSDYKKADAIPTFTIVDSNVEFDNNAVSYQYEFRFWDTEKNGFATFTTAPTATKPYVRWYVDYNKSFAVSTVKGDVTTTSAKINYTPVIVIDTNYKNVKGKANTIQLTYTVEGITSNQTISAVELALDKTTQTTTPIEVKGLAAQKSYNFVVTGKDGTKDIKVTVPFTTPAK